MNALVAGEVRLPWVDLQQVVSELAAVRQRWREARNRSVEPAGRDLPSRAALAQIMDGLLGALFPMRLGPPDLRQENEDFYVGHTLDAVLQSLWQQLQLALRHSARERGDRRGSAYAGRRDDRAGIRTVVARDNHPREERHVRKPEHAPA